MRFFYRMPWAARMRLKRTLGATVCAAGVLILLTSLPPWIWPAILGLGLTTWGLVLLSLD